MIKILTSGVTMGTALAVSLSYDKNKSIPWAVLHGMCSWGYVAYRGVKG